MYENIKASKIVWLKIVQLNACSETEIEHVNAEDIEENLFELNFTNVVFLCYRKDYPNYKNTWNLHVWVQRAVQRLYCR
jgi:hypothetical protein